MTEELKTLKELVEWTDDELSFGGYTLGVLRTEAINWVNQNNEFIKRHSLNHYHRNYSDEAVGKDSQNKWIINFFNLKESDIK